MLNKVMNITERISDLEAELSFICSSDLASMLIVFKNYNNKLEIL